MTAVVIVALAALASAALLFARRDRSASATGLAVPVAVVVITVALATLPFAFNERVGVLGEGIYTNDHAAQLYWSAWLQTGFGPEPAAVQFGYPIGPQAVAVVVAEATGASLVAAFNGLLLAVAALTGLTALGALRGFGPLRRIAIASLSALPYLAASFLTQSAFKETVMALLVLAFAIALQAASRGRRDRGSPDRSWCPGRRSSPSASCWRSRACSPSRFPASPGSCARSRFGSCSRRSRATARSTGVRSATPRRLTARPLPWAAWS